MPILRSGSLMSVSLLKSAYLGLAGSKFSSSVLEPDCKWSKSSMLDYSCSIIRPVSLPTNRATFSTPTCWFACCSACWSCLSCSSSSGSSSIGSSSKSSSRYVSFGSSNSPLLKLYYKSCRSLACSSLSSFISFPVSPNAKFSFLVSSNYTFVSPLSSLAISSVLLWTSLLHPTLLNLA